MNPDDTCPAKSHYEAELLLRCASARPADKSCDRVKELLRTGIDWQHLFQTADAHGVVPLLYKFLNETCLDAVPEVEFNRLRDRFIKNAQSALALTAELLKILELLKAHGIPAIAYKGPALATAVYGDVALRQFIDLDILVRKQDVFDVEEILIKHEYNPASILTEAQKTAFLDNHYDYVFLRKDSDALVEIHWEVAEGFLSFPLKVESLFERAQSVVIGGRPVPTLSPEDSLLVLCIHGSKHLWTRLEWISDVTRLIEHEKELNWRQASERAAALGIKRMLLLGLFLANELLSAPLPGEMLEQVEADRVVKRLGAQVVKQLFNPADESLQMIKHSLFFIRARERVSDRVRCGLRMAFAPTDKDRMSIRLPRAFSFLYYLLRPIRLVGKYGFRRII